MERPDRVIETRAPLRTNDIGGWTDTWFARRGRVLNLAVVPGVEVRIEVFGNSRRDPERVLVRTPADGGSLTFAPEDPGPADGRHALLRHAVGAFVIPGDVRLEIDVCSPVPPGFATGTSASVCVALIEGLDRLTGGSRTADEIADLARRIETEKLGRQCGVQDQIAAARGGVNFIRMTAYPRAEVETLRLEAAVRDELDRRLRLVGLGGSHDSSALHERVIAELDRGSAVRARLDEMSGLAEDARARLLAGDLEGYGRIMIANNECQRALAEGIVPPAADEVIRIARMHRASGWKVNGAGGPGSSMTLLASPDETLARALDLELKRGQVSTFDISLSRPTPKGGPEE